MGRFPRRARLPVPRPSNGLEPHLLVELLEGSAARRYEELGLDFATSDDIANTRALDCIREAMSILARVPSLRDTVFQLVKVIHILRAQGDEYDVSHSDPVVPFSVFVSVPDRHSPYHSVRVAESIIHEAMHLQLTLLENTVSLVFPTEGKYYSPWMGTYRSPRGILHGLYVFAVIYSFFNKLTWLPNSPATIRGYIQKRQCQIAMEVSGIAQIRSCVDLTRAGIKFVEWVYRSPNVTTLR